MNAANIDKNLIDAYLALLNNLSHDSKLELIAKLSLSMKAEKKQDPSLKELFGAFVSDKTADEQIEEIRAARVFIYP